MSKIIKAFMDAEKKKRKLMAKLLNFPNKGEKLKIPTLKEILK